MNGCFGRMGIATAAIAILLSGQTPVTGGGRLFQQMQATGKPALVIAGSVDCVYCREMAAELEGNAALRPQLDQLFVVKVDTDSKEWPLLKNEFKFEGAGIPAVFFVRADGKLLYADSGKPRDMELFLNGLVAEAGQILDPKSLEGMRKEAGRLRLALKRGDRKTAIELLKKRSGTGSFAAAALAFDAAAKELTDKATAEIAAAEAKLLVSSTQLEGAMALLEASQTYTGYEPLETPAAAAIERAREDAAIEEVLQDAERLNQAAEHLAQHRRPEAASIYREVIASRPNSAAAAFAAARLKALE